MRLDSLTFHECEKYLEDGPSGLIIPIGTCEQHGYHLPLHFDTFVAEYFAEYLSAETHMLIAPTVNYGVNLPCDMHMAGTASIPEGVLRGQLASIIDWWRAQGFSRFVIVTYHGDSHHLDAMRDLGRDTLLLDLGEVEYADILEKQTSIRHACEAETSVALCLCPGRVRLDEIREHDIPHEAFKAYLSHESKDKPEGYAGCLGWPSYASEEKGRVIVDRMKNRALRLCKAFVGGSAAVK